MGKFRVSSVFFAAIGIALAAFLAYPAFAQNAAQAPSPFSTPDGDWAVAWINYLFRGADLPGSMAGYGARLAPMAEGLRKALGIYSVAMMIIGSILVFYHIASGVVNTAHDGVVLGKRANQVWAPIRLVVAIVLLVPVGSGLSAGQYLVLKLAGQGSALASNAWRTVIDSMNGNVSTLVHPAPPNVAALAAAATDMEICRLIYADQYAGLQQQEQWARLIGPMGDLIRIPANHVADETWLYTNTINSGTAMCGAYRFPGYRPHQSRNATDNVARMTDDLSAFAHTEAESIIVQARTIATRAAPDFRDTAIPNTFSIQYDVASLEKAIQSDVTAHLLRMDAVNSGFTDGILTGPAEAGWVAAVVFIPEFIRLQESYGELVSHMLPQISSPAFAHPAFSQRVLNDAILSQPAFNNIDRNVIGSISQFYVQVTAPVSAAHNWLYGTQLGDNDYVPPDGFDIHDQLNAATDPGTAFAFFARALDTAAISQGVWGTDGREPDAGNPFAAPMTGTSSNPLTALIEYGRRQYELGLYLTGIAGAALSVTMATAPAALTGFLGLGFLLGGLGLIFIVPVVPFLRFLFAILVWLLDLFEAIAAMPIVALAHLTPFGEGLSGGAARQAYLLWIGLLIRPTLALFGLVLGFLLFAIGMAFLAIVLSPFAHLAAASNSGALVVANSGLILLYDVLAYVIANAAFKGIYMLPDQALRWISPFVVTERDVQQPQPAAPAPAGLSSIPVVAQIANGPRSEGGAPLEYGVRSQTNLFPIHYSEKRVDQSHETVQGSDAPHYSDGKTPNVTQTATTNVTTTSSSSSVTSATVLAGKDGGGSVPPTQRGNNKTSPYTNVPFFQSKDKPNNER